MPPGHVDQPPTRLSRPSDLLPQRNRTPALVTLNGRYGLRENHDEKSAP